MELYTLHGGLRRIVDALAAQRHHRLAAVHLVGGMGGGGADGSGRRAQLHVGALLRWCWLSVWAVQRSTLALLAEWPCDHWLHSAAHMHMHSVPASC